MTRIEIRGRTFEVERLGLDEAFNGLELAQEIFGSPARPPVSKVPRLLKLFAKVAKVARAADGNYLDPGAPRVALDAFYDEVFKGEIGLAFDFVVKCVELEYGNFLDGLPGVAAPAAPTPKP